MCLDANVEGEVMQGQGGREGGSAPQEKGLLSQVAKRTLVFSRRNSEGSGDQGFYFVLLCPPMWNVQ